MAKTLAPGTVTIPRVGTFVANAVPDPFDERDLEYRPRLQPLPAVLDQRATGLKRHILFQKGNSCTGHAVATLINTVLAPTTRLPRVSPYMLYRLARRYDEWEGEADEGSSLRGAFKGWFHHGVALERDWPDLDLDPEPDLDAPAFIAACRDRPLGAFYRVNPYRLDDVQSAINELRALAVSGVVHDGWITPKVRRKGRDTLHVIERPVNAQGLGGHAFALVGYNEVGFLVQNSWGRDWGKGGFATLPYEDWLDSAYDAWVARPGVPKTPFASGRTGTKRATGGELATGPGPDLRRLAMHVVNLGNNGRLSTTGKFVSTPAQVDKAFEHIDRWHQFWAEREPGAKRRIVLYAHGGLVGEAGGLQTAQKQLNWWLNNRVYPLTFAWQTGPAETLLNQLVDAMRGRLPFGGLGFDLVEQFDRLVEKVARSNFRWMWDEMKENARAAAEPITDPDAVRWPPTSAATIDAMTAMPGASLTTTRLAVYVERNGAENVAVHLVGHSAGSIFHAALLQRLAELGVKVDSMALLAPAIRVDEFGRDILPHLGPGKTVARMATFAMSDRRELDDTCGANGISIYQKSLLYLVSRALERSADGKSFEVPLLGMERFFDRPLGGQNGTTLRQAIRAAGGVPVFSRSAAPADQRSDASAHGGFDDDAPTMTSVVMRILGAQAPAPEHNYQPNAALRDADRAPILDGTQSFAASGPDVEAMEPTPAPGARAGAMPLTTPAETHDPGEAPVVETAAPQTQQPVPPPQPEAIVIEVAVAPRSGSPIGDVLVASGWTQDGGDATNGTQPQTRARARRKPAATGAAKRA